MSLPTQATITTLGQSTDIAGALKSVYDLGLYLTFRTVAVEGERAPEAASAG